MHVRIPECPYLKYSTYLQLELACITRRNGWYRYITLVYKGGTRVKEWHGCHVSERTVLDWALLFFDRPKGSTLRREKVVDFLPSFSLPLPSRPGLPIIILSRSSRRSDKLVRMR